MPSLPHMLWADLEQVVAFRPDHDEAHYFLGQSYVRLGRREEGRRELEIHERIRDSAPVDSPVASGGLR